MAAGHFVVRRKPDVSQEVSKLYKTPDQAKAHSLALLAALGIPEGELGVVVQKRVLKESTGNVPREVVSQLTFVERAVEGIPVLGSRIVVTHTPSGALTKLRGSWPTIAPSGHQLKTSLSAAQVSSKVTGELESLQLSGRIARFQYAFNPAPSSPLGGIALSLVADVAAGDSDASAAGAKTLEIVVALN